MQTLKAAILIVSDTASQDASTDKTTSILEDVFRSAPECQWTITDRAIVPDNVPAIRASIERWTDGEDIVNLIVTSGGTGFGTKDVTPEAVAYLLHKQAPGLIHAMFTAGLAVTPFAAMARLVAGVRRKSILMTLPGSPKGAVENLQAVLKLLPHACQQVAGANSRELHAGGVERLEQEAGITSHATACEEAGHHANRPHTHSNDHSTAAHPEEQPARRHRKSPYPMISFDDALKLVIEQAPPPTGYARVPVTDVPLGSVLAKDVRAREDVPAFRASIVDGYAIRVSDQRPFATGVYPVASVSNAEPGSVPPLKEGEVARVTTGAPLPEGATAVVMVEDTMLRETSPDGLEELKVEILTDRVKPGENVREIASDTRKGELVLAREARITAADVGLLTSVGAKWVDIYHQPTAAVLSTGNELVEDEVLRGASGYDYYRELQLGEVRDCNRPGLLAALKSFGFEADDLGILKDSSRDLKKMLQDSIPEYDVIITTGGASMGELDLMKPTLERELGATLHFGRIAMAPGKPTTFATMEGTSKYSRKTGKTAFFCLPGNPASAMVGLHTLVLPYLHQASGMTPPGHPRVLVTLHENVKALQDRPQFHRAVVTAGRDGLLHAKSTGGQRSSRVASLRGANALLWLQPSPKPYPKGTQVEALLIGPLESELGG
ncbi:MAG: hypothetical protein M1823_002094 [Watsoniomyces obsoletus]|nr:MAG: hypothetical protein M1823_002094 [Watsoniomyces obsoletus]